MSQNLVPTQAGQPLIVPPISVPSPDPSIGTLDNVGPAAPTGGTQETYQDVTGGPASVSYTSPQPGSDVGQYTTYALTTTYLEDMGLRAIPVCGPPGTPMEIVREHAGTFYKVVSFLVQRRISLPQLPSANTNNPNETLFCRQVSPAMPGILPDGCKMWTIQGRYVYAMRVGPSENDILTCGVSPLALNAGGSVSDGNLPPSVWSQSLISPSVPPAGAAGLSSINF